MPTYIPEHIWLKKADSPILKLIEDWHRLCKENIGVDMEFMLSSRYEHPRFRNVKGTLNFALPNSINGRIFYGVYLEKLENFDPIILSHELCHPLLKIKGLKSMRDEENIQSLEENFLNSLCDHPLVYEEQRKYGHSTSNMINRKATGLSVFMSRKNVSFNDKDRIINSLNVADSIYQSPRSLSRKILRNAKKNNKEIYERVILIIDIMNNNDIYNYKENMIIRKNIIKELSINDKWTIRDDLEALRDLCEVD